MSCTGTPTVCTATVPDTDASTGKPVTAGTTAQVSASTNGFASTNSLPFQYAAPQVTLLNPNQGYGPNPLKRESGTSLDISGTGLSLASKVNFIFQVNGKPVPPVAAGTVKCTAQNDGVHCTATAPKPPDGANGGNTPIATVQVVTGTSALKTSTANSPNDQFSYLALTAPADSRDATAAPAGSDDADQPAPTATDEAP